jgi:uncharacterized protein (TIGR02598 family)
MAIHASRGQGYSDPGAPKGPLAGECRAFSLIEVVIAIGIFAFAIVPIIGLLGSGMGTLKDSMSDTVRSDIARRVVGEFQRMPYSNLISGIPKEYFYDVEGGVADSKSAIFKATVTLTSLSDLNSVITTDSNNALMLSVTVQHVSDTNSRTRYSQMLVNTAQ